MIATALLATTLAPLTVADFFPLKAGTRSYFAEKSLMASETYDLVGTPETVGGGPATPVITYQAGQKVNTTYYRLEGDTVSIVAYDAQSPLPQAMPVIRWSGKKTTWEYQGRASGASDADAMIVTGEANLGGDRKVLGEKLPVLIVKTRAVVGNNRLQEGVEQMAVYAKGIGLVELTSTTRLGNKAAKHQLRLTKVEGGTQGE